MLSAPSGSGRRRCRCRWPGPGVVVGHNRCPVPGLVVEVFEQTQSQEGTAQVENVLKTAVPEGADCRRPEDPG